jgi:hypothetical protein
VYYTRLDHPDWEPVDIFITGENMTGLNAAPYALGIGLLWDGDTFAWSAISPRASAKEWHGPAGLDAAYPNADLAHGLADTLWAVYGAVNTNEIMVQRLRPARAAWESPLLVGDPVNTNASPDNMRLAVAADGRLHAVWTEYELPNGWPPLGLFYAQSSDEGRTWTVPYRIAGPTFNQPNVVAGPGAAVYLTWTGTAGTGDKYFQESLDGGTTWSDPEVVLPSSGGGSEGAPNLVVDSAGGLHLVAADNGCVWYVARENGVWGVPECISAAVTASAFIETPALAIGQGNHLHVLFYIDRRQLWYTTRQLAAEASTPAPTPTVPTLTPVPPTVTVAPTASRTPLPDYGPAPAPGAITTAGYAAIVAGLLPVPLLVLTILAARGRRKR